MRKLSRMEANKEVRRVLSRHATDFAYAYFSVTGLEIRLTGWLVKNDNTDFNAPQIESMLQEFKRYLPAYTVAGDFDNWKFTSNHISFIGDRALGKEGEETHQLVDGVLVDYYEEEDDEEAS